MTSPIPPRRHASIVCGLTAAAMLSCLFSLAAVHWYQARFSGSAQAAFERDAVRLASVWTYRKPVCDRYGAPLNTTVDSYALAISPSQVRDLRDTRDRTLDLVETQIARLAVILWPGNAELRKALRTDLEAHLRWSRPMPFILWRDLDSRTLQRWLLVRGQFPGITLLSLPQRVYHLPDLAPLIRGRVFSSRRGGPDLTEHCDFPDLTMKGWYGVEAWLDAQLCGTPGLDRLCLDAAQFRHGAVRKTEPEPGRAICLTLDMTVQRWAQEALDGLRGPWLLCARTVSCWLSRTPTPMGGA